MNENEIEIGPKTILALLLFYLFFQINQQWCPNQEPLLGCSCFQEHPYHLFFPLYLKFQRKILISFKQEKLLSQPPEDTDKVSGICSSKRHLRNGT